MARAPKKTESSPVSAPSQALDALDRGIGFLAKQQHPEGCVAGEVVWNPMLAAQYVMAAHMTGQSIDAHRKQRLLRHFQLWQNADGGWGLHAESHSYLYVTTLSYIALRLMGLSADEGPCPRGRAWLDAHCVVEIPTWGKLWLCMMNLYDYEGVHPISPEIWLLPEWAPVHPRRFYCHTRLIYMGFSYLYGTRFQAPLSPVIEELRGELYPDGFAIVDWPAQRSALAETDTYQAPNTVLRAGFYAAGLFEKVAPALSRRYALKRVLERIVWEERTSNYAGISPVNGTLNALALHAAGHADAQKAFEGIDYWMWDDEEEGLRIAGASSNTWDTSFAVQAIADGPLRDQYEDVLSKMYGFLDDNQVRRELPGDFAKYFRLPSMGGWCFGEKHHHWPVSDCTAEALCAIARVHTAIPDKVQIRPGRIRSAVRFVLLRHNEDGGWGSYESQRGNKLLEHVNPAEMFGNCMSEYSYLECTASCIQGLTEAREAFPDALTAADHKEIERVVARGERLIRSRQEADGSWSGFWGINYTYGTLFAISGLLAAGVPRTDPAILSGCRWLVDNQLPGGGWGEAWQSCVEDRYIPHEQSQVIMTSWALMALLRAGYDATEAIDDGIQLLLERQRPSGEWRRESQAGIFFNTAGLHYDLYRMYFPIWALSLYCSAPNSRAL